MNTSLVPVNVDDVVSLKEGADMLNITYSAICELLKARPHMRDAFTFKMKYEGRRKTVITKKGLFILGSSKDGDRGNESKIKAGSNFDKEEYTARKIIALSDDPIIAMRMKQLELEKEVLMLKDRTESIEDALGEAKNNEVTPLQREKLNERVRGLAINLNLPFSTAWRHVHNHVGKSSINDYEFKDYAVANKLLRGLYKKNDLPWGL